MTNIRNFERVVKREIKKGDFSCLNRRLRRFTNRQLLTANGYFKITNFFAAMVAFVFNRTTYIPDAKSDASILNWCDPGSKNSDAMDLTNRPEMSYTPSLT